MRIPKLPTSALTATIALMALAGCGGSSQITPTSLAQPGVVISPLQRADFQNGRLTSVLAMHRHIVTSHSPARPSFMDSRAVGKPLLFIGSPAYPNGTIDIYLQGGKNKMVGQITGPPGAGYDLATDRAGNLYSVNFSNPSSVTVYAPPYTKGPKLTLSVETTEIAVSRQGTIAVATCTKSGSQCDPGVVFYAAGSATPCATVLTHSAFPNGASASAFDHKGSLYLEGVNSAQAAIFGRIDGGCDAKKVTTFTTANPIAGASDLNIDKAGRIAILAFLGTYPYTIAIDTYDPPKKGSLGNPVSTTTLPGSLLDSGQVFVFQASGRRLWASYNGVGSSPVPDVYEFAYPAGGAPEKTIMGSPNSFFIGVAVTPALVP